MNEKNLMDIHILVRKKYNLLLEVLEKTKDMGIAMDKQDEGGVAGALESRIYPIERLEALKKEIQGKLDELSPADKAYTKKVLTGKEFSTKPEEALMKQALDNKKLLEEIMALNTKLNQRLSVGQ